MMFSYSRIKNLLLSLSLVIGGSVGIFAQSASFGNTFIHENGESVVFGKHDFLNGGFGVLPGVVGTEREGEKGFFGFSNVSTGWEGASKTRYVDGYVKYYGSGGFTFPVGDDGYFRPVAVSGAAETKVAYFRVDPSNAQTTNVFGGDHTPLPIGAPFNRQTTEPQLTNVSDMEYWDIDGDTPTKITLTWDFDSELSRLTNNDLQKLTIVGWNGTEWVKIPSSTDIVYLAPGRSAPSYTGGVSNLTTGSITSIATLVPDTYMAYTFGAVGLAMIGDLVWEDMNRNGIQEENEPPIPGALVELYDEDKLFVSSTTTDAFGRYFFEGVIPGSYYVKFINPSSYAITLVGQGKNELNSDITFSGFSPKVVIGTDEVDFSIDGGFYRNGSIGNTVWLDDGDGIRQDYESAIKDVVIELLDEEGNLIASTISADNGSYIFTNLPPGSYMLRFVLPPGYNYSPFHSTTDGTIDSDVDPTTGTTEMITLLSGQELMDYDAGFSAPCEYTATAEVTQPSCGGGDGVISIIVNGDSGPYNYQWSNGGTTSSQVNLSSGDYQITVSDSENCFRAFNITLDGADDCELICGELQTAVFLEGAFNYDALEMDNKLNNLGYLPGQIPTTFFGKYTDAGQPYTRVPWSYYGNEGKDFDAKSKSDNNKDYPFEATDWVLVSLREDINVEYATCTRAGLLMQDGTIEFMENEDCCYVDPTKSYHVVIEHRNHLVVMSKDPMPVVDGKITHDFRNEQSYTRLFGYGQKEVSPGVFVMYAANGDQYVSSESPVDINVGDLTEWLKENGQHSSYYFMDFDLNGDANVQDKGLYLKNIGIFTDVPKEEE